MKWSFLLQLTLRTYLGSQIVTSALAREWRGKGWCVKVMDYIKRFDIEIDKSTYYAGELLTGHVIVENIENIKVQSIRVFIRGKSHCQWKVTRAGEKRTMKEDEYYMDQKTLLWGKNATDEGSVPILPRGLHKLPIEYQIPETNLPCSFESKIGRIRYYLRVVINIPYASHPQGIKYFTVIGPHIDCMDATYLTPTTATDKRKSCCFCLFGGPVVLKAVMERSAYCCGERIKLKAEVQNGCDQKVWLICRLMQHVDYFINRGVLGLRKDHTVKVWEHQSENVQPHQTVNFDQLQDHLQVPVMPPTLLNVSSLVNIYYELTVSLGMERSSEDLDISLPLTIATVPFRIPNTPSPPLHFEFAAPNVEGGMYISPEFQLGQVYMGDDDEENDETILYRPVYCAVQHDDISVTNTNNVSSTATGNRSPRLPIQSANSPRIMNKSPIFRCDDANRDTETVELQEAGCSGEQTRLLAERSRVETVSNDVHNTKGSRGSCAYDETLEHSREQILDSAVFVTDLKDDILSTPTVKPTTSSAIVYDVEEQKDEDNVHINVDSTTPLINQESRSLSTTPVRHHVHISTTKTSVQQVTKTLIEESCVTSSYSKYRTSTETKDSSFTNNDAVDFDRMKAKSAENLLSASKTDQCTDARKTKSSETVCVEIRSTKGDPSMGKQTDAVDMGTRSTETYSNLDRNEISCVETRSTEGEGKIREDTDSVA